MYGLFFGTSSSARWFLPRYINFPPSDPKISYLRFLRSGSAPAVHKHHPHRLPPSPPQQLSPYLAAAAAHLARSSSSPPLDNTVSTPTVTLHSIFVPPYALARSPSVYATAVDAEDRAVVRVHGPDGCPVAWRLRFSLLYKASAPLLLRAAAVPRPPPHRLAIAVTVQVCPAPPVDVAAAEPAALAVPLSAPFTITSSRLNAVSNVVVHIELRNGTIGWGRPPCCHPSPTRTSRPRSRPAASLRALLDEGVLEAIRISCASYPTKRTFDELIIDRFGMLAPELVDSSDEKAACAAIRDRMGLKGYQVAYVNG
ncbi:uncharacterized protein LOC101774745 [Setaria italica]|nr:uncharacterized protein LOC101774745 [Setaria italica]